MFHKDSSSTTTDVASGTGSGKKAKDVPLRKSDRLTLLQTAVRVLFASHERADSDDAAATATAQHVEEDATTTSANSTNDPLHHPLLKDIFLNGSLVKRLLKLSTGTATLYIRSPNAGAKPNDGENDVSTWPYTQTSQCIWLQVELVDEPRMLYDVPSLALLSVLRFVATTTETTNAPPTRMNDINVGSGNNNNLAVVTVPSAVSHYICRGAHLMRAGMRSIVQAQCGHERSLGLTNTATTTTALSKLKAPQRPRVVVAVCVQGNSQPFAIGLLVRDLEPAIEVATQSGLDDPTVASVARHDLIGVGTKGFGVTILHAYGDDIWRQQVPAVALSLSRKAAKAPLVKSDDSASTIDWNNGHYGNLHFHNGERVDSGSDSAADEDSDDEIEEPPPPTLMENNQDATVDSSSPAAPVVTDEQAISSGTTALVSDAEDNNLDDMPAANALLPLPSETEESTAAASGAMRNAPEDSKPAMSPNEILHDAVCRALVMLHAKRDLPMTLATFYAQHVLPNRSDTSITIKHTTYKKFGPYLHEQVQAGLLTLGPDPKQKQPADNGSSGEMGMLIGYNRRHDDLVPYIQQLASTSSGADNGTNNAHSTSRSRLVLADLYIVPQHFGQLLRLERDVVKAEQATSQERKGTGMLTVKEVRAILDDYVTREGLVVPDCPDQVQLDGPLTDALYKKKKKKAQGADASQSAATEAIPMTLSRKDIMNVWLECMEPAFALVQVPGNQILSLGRGQPPKVTVEVSKRSGNKFVTVVTGLESYRIDPNHVAKDVSHRFACASSVSAVGSGNSNGGVTSHKPGGPMEVLLQGNLSDELEALLLGDEGLSSHGGVKDSPYQLPKNSIDVVLQKGVPARKKRATTSKR